MVQTKDKFLLQASFVLKVLLDHIILKIVVAEFE